jgi:hypothetical protein
MISITANRMKRGVQWDRSQIRVREGPNFLFCTPIELYFDLNNIVMSKCSNY